MNKITVKNIEISITGFGDDDFISLTDIARAKNPKEPKDVVKNWMRLRSTLEFLGIWETLNNQSFNRVEFDPSISRVRQMKRIINRFPNDLCFQLNS